LASVTALRIGLVGSDVLDQLNRTDLVIDQQQRAGFRFEVWRHNIPFQVVAASGG
jgi:fructose 1,6-bisphosphatase